MKPISKLKTSLAALAMVSSAGAFAIPLTGVSSTGTITKYEVSGSSLVVSPATPLNTILTGDATSPTGNVELGRLGVLSGSLTGTFLSSTITFSGLNFTDWSVTGLAQQYIAAAAASIGATLTAPQLAFATQVFLGDGVGGATDPWQLVSDPNISYANVDRGILSVGLAGYFDATPVLAALFPNQSVPAGSQASEVVKISVNGGPAQYLYSFDATPTGLSGPLANSFSGNYEVTLAVPEPSSIALLGLGLAGVALSRRRKAKKAA